MVIISKQWETIPLKPVWYDNPSGMEIRPESVVIGYRDQLRHIASVKLWIVNSRFPECKHNDFHSSFYLH